MKRYLITVPLALLVLAACSGNKTPSAARKAAQSEQLSAGRTLQRMIKTQPIPERPWSQLRQNLIEIETAQIDTTRTTTFFFNLGVAAPIQSCPSIGYPIPSTNQLTNPEQIIQDRGDRSGGNLSLPQIDPNGVYTGQSTGTYVMCVDAQGRAYADYWEGFVQTVTGPAEWNDAKHAVELVGPPSFDFSAKKEG